MPKNVAITKKPGLPIKERPVPFTAEMIKAVLDIRKTQTRRVINKVLRFGQITEFGKSDTPGYDWHFRDRRMYWNDLRHAEILALCPYGQPGDRLWVKETWAVDQGWDYLKPSDLPEKAYTCIVYPGTGNKIMNPLLDFQVGKTRPGMFMTRQASRILLEIVKIRIELVQEITAEDCLAEGIELTGSDIFIMESWPTEERKQNIIQRFQRLWNSINAERGYDWDSNPGVWVVEFKLIDIRKGDMSYDQ